jgi:hypothetical protein
MSIPIRERHGSNSSLYSMFNVVRSKIRLPFFPCFCLNKHQKDSFTFFISFCFAFGSHFLHNECSFSVIKLAKSYIKD